MKIYILTVTKERAIESSKIVVENEFIDTFPSLSQAKDFIEDLKDENFYRNSSRPMKSPSGIVYRVCYEDRYSTGDSNTYYIYEKEFGVPEIEENEDLKKSIKKLKKEIEELKASQNKGFTTKEAFHTESTRETKKVNFW